MLNASANVGSARAPAPRADAQEGRQRQQPLAPRSPAVALTARPEFGET